MDDETERELSIEQKVNTINLYQFYRKPHLTRFFDNAELLYQTLNVSSTEIAEFMRTIFLIIFLFEQEIFRTGSRYDAPCSKNIKK